MAEEQAPPQEESLRDSISAAFDTVEAAESQETPAPEPTPQPAPAPGDKESPAPVKEPPQAHSDANKPPAQGATPAKPSQPGVAGDKTPPQGQKPAIDAQPPRRAPSNWKPQAREKWNDLPKEIQTEVLRREAEIARGFSETAQAREFHDQFQRTVQPYANIVAAEGGDPMRLVNNLLSTAGALYHGSQAQKVNVVAGFIRNFGVDIASLDTVLSENRPMQHNGGNGHAPMDAQAYIRNEIHAALAPLLRQQQGATDQQIRETIEEFANNPENEFYPDVKNTMADLLEVAARQNQKMDLPTAYKRATMLHSDIAEVVTERELRRKAAEQSSAAQAARRRGSSLTGAPSRGADSSDRPDTLRGDIEAAWDQLSA